MIVLLSAQCELSMDTGRFCGKYAQKWYYNSVNGACLPFWYGGCDGNSNRFNTETECFERCGVYSKLITSHPMNVIKDYVHVNTD